MTNDKGPITTSRPKKGAVLDLAIEKFADRGKSLARHDGYVVFVAGAVPGDRVRARLIKRRKGFGEARILEVLEESPLRTTPRCEYFWDCGGCKWQHVEYDAQLEAKRQSVEDALRHAGGFRDVVVPAPIGAEQTYFYRNKMEFSFAAHRWLTDWEIASGDDFDRDFALGLHVPGRYDKVLDLKACYLQSEWSARLVNATRAFAKAHGWTPWDVHQHTGYLRHLVLRTPEHTDENMVNLVTNGRDDERMAAYAAFLRAEFPEVTTLVNTINTGVAQTARVIDQAPTLRAQHIAGPGRYDRQGQRDLQGILERFLQSVHAFQPLFERLLPAGKRAGYVLSLGFRQDQGLAAGALVIEPVRAPRPGGERVHLGFQPELLACL